MRTALALSIAFAGGLLVSSARAEAELSGPSLQTEGKPTSPPAPVQGMTPRLGSLNVMGGAMIADFGPVNDRLSNAGYSNKLPSVFPMMGGQGFGLFSRFLIGGSGAGLFSQSKQMAPGLDGSAGGAWGTFDFGYQLVRVNGFLLAPVVCLGGYGMGVTLSSTTQQSFDEVLAAPARGSSLSNKGALAGIAVLANLVVLGSPSSVPDARTGLSLGLRIGGLYGIPFREWQADGVEASDGPSFGLRGGYAALSLGPSSF